MGPSNAGPMCSRDKGAWKEGELYIWGLKKAIFRCHVSDILNIELDGGFRYFLFSPLFGEDSQFDKYFSNGLKPPPS